MSETTYPQGPLTTGKQFQEIVNGWTRDTTWISDAGSLCGDYAVGSCTEVYYRKTLPNGRVLGVEIVVYFSVHPDAEDREEPLEEAQIFMEERDFFHSAPSLEAFEAQEFDVEDYEYEEAGAFFRNLEAGEVKPEDMRWLVEWWGDVDARDYLLWEGAPIR